MGMQTDVVASGVRTTTGQLQTAAGTGDLARSRVKAILIIPTANAGSVVFRDGGATGPIKMTVPTLAGATSASYMLLPGEGTLFQTDVHVTLSDVTSVMVFYA